MKVFLIIAVLVYTQSLVCNAQTVNAKGGGESTTETKAANLKSKAANAKQICLDKIWSEELVFIEGRKANPESLNAASVPVGKISKTVTYSKGK